VKTGTRRFRLISLALLVCLVIVSMVTGCPKPAPTITEWNLPVLSVLTGPVAFAGVPAQWGAQYAVDEINASGGLMGIPIKLTAYDTAFDNAKAVAAMARAIPGSLVVLGPLDGSGAAAVAQVVIDARIPNISEVTAPETRSSMAPYGTAYMQDTAEGMVKCGLKWIELNPYIKSVAVCYMPPQPASVSAFDEVQTAFTQAGVKVVPVEIMPTQLDFGPAVLNAMDAGVDGYIDLTLESTHVGIAKELFNRGITQGTELIAGMGCDGAGLFIAGEGYLENSYIQENINPVDPNPAWQKLVTVYKEDFGGQLPINPVVGFYDAVYAFKNAVETLEITGDPAKLAQEREAITNYLFNSTQFQGLQFPYQYVNGKKVAQWFLLQIKNNEYTKAADVMP